MASLDDNNQDLSVFIPVASFYKLILKPRNDLQQLGIPRKFMKTHGNELSNTIHLKTPPGKVWRLGLVREDDDNKAFLQKGWPEFVEYYSLKHGHFLMFHYQGNSDFDVIICDTTASEIMYPLFDDSYSCVKKIPSNKRKHTQDLTNAPSSSKKVKEMQMVVDDKLIIGAVRGKNHLTRQEDKRIRAYVADQCMHPCFAIKMQPSFVEPGFYLGVPKKFVNKYLHKEKPCFECECNLLTDDNEKMSWPVKIVGEKSHVRFKTGWRNFVSENKVKVGDICVFELISKQRFKVHLRCS